MKFIYIFSIVLFSVNSIAQNSTNEKRGTIRVRKTGDLVKIMYDNVNYRLIGVDRFGNLLENAVVSYQVMVTIQGVFHSEKIVGSTLSTSMQNTLSRCGERTPVYFKKIKAKDKNGSLLDMPDFQYLIGREGNFRDF